MATFCIERGLPLLHHDRDFDAMETHLGRHIWACARSTLEACKWSYHAQRARGKALAYWTVPRHHHGMARVVFTPNLQRHLSCPVTQAPGCSVRAVLDHVFADQHRLRSYVLDDQGRVRRHVTIYVNADPIADRQTLSDPVGETDEIFVFQALSGG